jgi:hypothetical protein
VTRLNVSRRLRGSFFLPIFDIPTDEVLNPFIAHEKDRFCIDGFVERDGERVGSR